MSPFHLFSFSVEPCRVNSSIYTSSLQPPEDTGLTYLRTRVFPAAHLSNITKEIFRLPNPNTFSFLICWSLGTRFYATFSFESAFSPLISPTLFSCKSMLLTFLARIHHIFLDASKKPGSHHWVLPPLRHQWIQAQEELNSTLCITSSPEGNELLRVLSSFYGNSLSSLFLFPLCCWRNSPNK